MTAPDLVALVLRVQAARTPQSRIRAADALERGLAAWREANLGVRCPRCGYKRRASPRRQAVIA